MNVKRILCAALVFFFLFTFSACQTDTLPQTEEKTEFLMGDIVDVSKAEYTYEEMEADLFKLQELYPELLRVASAGQTLDGREIYYADFGSPDAEKKIMLNAGIHGREYMTTLLLMKQLEYRLVNYNTKNEEGISFADSFEGLSFRIVPMINPDGIAINQKGLEGIRSFVLREGIENIYSSDINRYENYREEYKNIDEYLVMWKANARGVDINRNFDIDYWSEMDTGIPRPSIQKYKGAEANSEPETEALVRLTEEMEGLVLAVSYHAQGEIIYWDCGQTGEMRAKTRELCEAISEITGYPLYNEFINPDATYNDWCTLNVNIPSVNVEIGIDKCPLPIEQFDSIWEKNIKLWETLAGLCKGE